MPELAAATTAMIDAELRKQIEQMHAEINSVYTERNLCIALLVQYARWFGYKVGMKKHVGQEWDDQWRNVLFIDLPAGQVSWHLHDREMVNFPDIPLYDGEWDGHTTEEKYERVKKSTNVSRSLFNLAHNL